MAVVPIQKNAADPFLAGRIQKLILGRLGLIFLLLLASWWWNNSFSPQSVDAFPSGLFLFLMFAIGLSGVYALLAQRNQKYQWQMRGQFFVDALLISWLIWETGDIFSPYISLYIFLISIVGYFLGRNDTLFFAFLSAGLFTAQAVVATQSLIFAGADDVPPSRSVQIIGFNTIAILLVGLLAARMSERRRIGEELRHTEESFADLHILHERIVESIGSGLITTDLEGRIYAFNLAASKISGLSAANTVGRSIFDLFSTAARVPIERCVEAARSGDHSLVHFEGEFRTPSHGNGGPGVAVACAAAPLLGRNGELNGLIISFEDVTQIRALEETVRRSDRLAAVGRMAAGLAHEIRNPLGSMSSALQFLQEKVPPRTDEASLMNVVLRESERLNGIITNFLAFARPAANGFSKGRPLEFDLAATIDDCLALLRHSPEFLSEHRISWQKPDTAIKIRADEMQIKQVLWNLLQNAIQAMPKGGDLTVSLEAKTKSPLVITITDTGRGFGPDQLEHLFEPFAAGSGGTGLGLSIVHKIVTDHGGNIEVSSTPGIGTAIRVEMPRKA